MYPYQITCCSTADLTPQHFAARSVEWVPFHFTMDGHDWPDDLGQSMPFKDFYAKIAAGAMPTTSQVSAGQFLQFFEPFLQAGQDILHISLSSGLSGAYNSACVAREELLEKYPDRSMIILDSLGASSGYGLLVETAADLRDKGSSLTDTATWLAENKLRLHHWFFSTDLTHYKRGGRISATSAVFGTLLQICPLMDMDAEGKLIQRQKIRTKKQVIAEIVKRMQQHAENGLAYSGKCYISHSACYEDARAVADMIEGCFLDLAAPVEINDVGTVIGAHTGPGTVALFFYGDTRQ